MRDAGWRRVMGDCMKAHLLASAAAGAGLLFAGAAEAATIRAVALQGQEAPGAGGARFGTFGTPALNDAGVAAFVASLGGAGVDFGNDSGLFANGALVARRGDAAPGAGGAVFEVFTTPILNEAGQAAYIGMLSGAGVSAANNRGIFVSDTLAARTGDPAPETGGALFSSFGAPSLNNSGETAFRAFVTGAPATAANNLGFFTPDSILAREREVAPGTGGALFNDFGFSAGLNDAGEAAFVGYLTGAGVTAANDAGLFTSNGLIAREGDAAPGAGGATYAFFGDPSLNNSGETAFVSILAGAGVTVENNSAIFAAGALVARKGDAAPGAGGALFAFLDTATTPALNDAGDTAFIATLAGPGVGSANNIAIFATRGGVLDLILRTGDLFDIGGGDLGAIIALSFAPQGFNNRGDIAFRAIFTLNNGAPREGIFVYEAGAVSAAVPLPPAFGLMLFGVAALGFVGRRRARA